MTQRFDFILAQDYMEFLTATTHLYKDRLLRVQSEITGFEQLRGIFSVIQDEATKEKALENLNEKLEHHSELARLLSTRIHLHRMEHQRCEYYMLNSSVTVGLHPDLSESFYNFSYEKMKTNISFH